MASSLGSSHQIASDIEYDYCCTRCEEDNKNSEALFYCTHCCKLYCDPCVKLHGTFYTGHSVLDRKNVDKWGVVRSEVAMCYEHKGEELQMYCKDHDMVYCLTCISEDHRSCKTVQHVPKVAKGIHQMDDFKKLPSDISNMIQQLSNMQDSRDKTHQLLLDACQDIIASLNKLRKKWTKLMDEIHERTLEQMNQLFAAMDVNIQSDKDTCKAKQAELKSLLQDMQTMGKNSETFAFSRFKKCRGKLSAAEDILQSMAKQDYKLTFTADTSIEQCLSTMSTFGEFTKSMTPPAASTSQVKTDHVYTVVNRRKYNVKMSDEWVACKITGCCTLPNGNTVIADNSHKKVKLLNNQYQVQADYDLHCTTHDICHIADSEVAVTVCDHVSRADIMFMDTRNDKLSLTRCFKLNHNGYGLAHHAGQLYVSSNSALYIYTMTGQLVKKLYEVIGNRVMWKMFESLLPDLNVTVQNFAISDDGRRIYITDPSHNSLITLDNTGKTLATLVDPDMKNPLGVHVSHDGSVFVCSGGSMTVIQAAADGKRRLATLARQKDGIENKPLSLCLDRKSSTLIVGQNFKDKLLVIKIE